jgi:16S rRNA (guanine527-N7)-methyltransferase
MRSRERPDLIQDLNPEEGRCLLLQGAAALGIDLSSRQTEQFMDYLTLLFHWTRHINLTGLRSSREIIIKHFLDSLTPLPFIPEEARLLDVGSGAGFPGLPIKIARPGQLVTLVEASAKKVSFLKEVSRHLKLDPLSIHHTYLGERFSPLKEGKLFDVVVTRAVGKTINLLTAADPYLRSGGKVLFMKGPKGLEEIFSLKTELLKREFQIEPPIVLTLPLLEQERVLIFITKAGGENT